jgi:hypothetical protein
MMRIRRKQKKKDKHWTLVPAVTRIEPERKIPAPPMQASVTDC